MNYSPFQLIIQNYMIKVHWLKAFIVNIIMFIELTANQNILINKNQLNSVFLFFLKQTFICLR